jgi:hypothetical protein
MDAKVASEGDDEVGAALKKGEAVVDEYDTQAES